MNLYNSLTKQVEGFKPQKEGEISIYSCGPTVYERAHIGNLASFIYADMLHRTLKVAFPDHKIKHVMNITDVDDKTIAASQAKYPNLEPTEALKKLTREYEDLFKQDLEVLGINTKEIIFVRATENIEPMQKLIKELLDKDFAYVADDGIYFSIEKYKQAGKKYGQLVEITADSTGQARVKNDEYDKDNIHDFALWKAQKENEPAWGFEVNGQNINGRPGWHIECSAMSIAELGQPFDIHTGGVDLKFPHHENEIAQSTSNNGDLLAQLFFHSEHILIDGKKMSKSLNNFYTLDDIRNKGFDPLAFRLLVLQSHYQNQAHFSWENLESAQNRLKDLRAWADLRYQPSTNVMGRELDELFGDTRQALSQAVESDLNTPVALTTLSKLVTYMQNIPIPGVEGKYTDGTLKLIDDLLGLDLSQRTDITSSQKELISEREKAREDKDWNKSDQLREQLEKQRIGLRDTDHGAVWYRT
jgi:cysteinyl-tRNA synthetase